MISVTPGECPWSSTGSSVSSVLHEQFQSHYFLCLTIKWHLFAFYGKIYVLCNAVHYLLGYFETTEVIQFSG